MTKIGEVSNVNAMRLTKPCPSALLIFTRVVPLAEHLFHCFSTGDSAQQPNWRGDSCNGAKPDPQSNEGTCQGTRTPVLQQGTSLQENSPSWHAGEEQAGQTRAAEPGVPLSPDAKGTSTGVGAWTGCRRSKVTLAGHVRMEQGRLCFKPRSSVTQKLKGKSLVSTLTLEERMLHVTPNSITVQLHVLNFCHACPALV